MNITIYLSALMLILVGMGGVLLVARLRLLRAAELSRTANSVDASRYEPLARLLASQDLETVSADRELSRQLRAHRVRVCRGYLRCLTKDFGALLGGLRLEMVNSNCDRPDLASLLVRSKWNFALTLCRAELRLFLYQTGIGTVDLTELVAQITAMRQLTPTLVAA